MAILKQSSYGKASEVITVTAGEDLPKASLVYCHKNGKYYLANNTTVEQADVVGINTIPASKNSSAVIQIGFGSFSNSNWSWTPGEPLYLGTDGNIVNKQTLGSPDIIKPIGFALSATSINFKTELGYISDEIDIVSDQLEISYNPQNYTRTVTSNTKNASHIESHLKGIDDKLQVVVSAIAGESIPQYSAVYTGSDSKIYRSANTSSEIADALGVTTDRLISGQSGNVVANGYVTNSLWNWTPNKWVYLSDVLGGLTQTEPSLHGSYVVPVGLAVSSNTIYVSPMSGWTVNELGDIDGDLINLDFSPSYYTPDIIDGVTTSNNQLGSHLRGIDNKLSGYVSLKEFGAVGDGVTDDTEAVQNALNSQLPLDWGGFTYRIISTVTVNIRSNLYWEGRKATIVYDSSNHSQFALVINDLSGVYLNINDITIDGSKKCNVALFLNNNTNMTTASTVIANNLYTKRVKRLIDYQYGSGLLVRGSFDSVTLNSGGSSDCEMPEDQGVAFSKGIIGIAILWYSTTSYVKRVVANGVHIEKIYSSDLSYQYDQDGLLYFSPTESNSGKVESELIVMGGSQFKNCYGRSIKSQCRNTVVRDSSFYRDEGLSSMIGNTEINSQTGTCVVSSNIFSYKNGYSPGTVVGIAGLSNWKVGAVVSANEVYLDDSTELPYFFLSYPNQIVSPWSRISIVQNIIIGSVNHFVEFLCNSIKNYISVEDNWVKEIGLGLTSERSLIYVRTSGTTDSNYAYVSASGNIYEGSESVYLARDSISGNSMKASYSAFNNFGFVNNNSSLVNEANPLQNNAITANITSSEQTKYKGFFGMQSKTVLAGSIETLSLSATTAIVLVSTASDQNTFALFSVGTSTVVISEGSSFKIGATSDPDSGTYRIWRSNSGQISIRNTSSSLRVFNFWIFSA